MNFFELMNSAVFRKTLENIRKHRDIKLGLFSIRTKMSCSNFFYKNLLTIEMRKAQILMNKPVHLGDFQYYTTA